MTIALDATPLTISTGGVPRYTLELARALAAEFPQDQYWLLSDQAFSLPSSLPPNLHTGSPPPDLLGRRWWLAGLDREMSRRQVDLFHGTDFSVPYLNRRPSVMTLHDLSPWVIQEGTHADPGARRVRRRTPILLRLGLAAMVITPSQAVRREAIDRFRLLPDRVVAIPLAASEAFRPVPATPTAKPYFLFVGTLESRKNIHRLIDAWREVRKARETHKMFDVDLVLAGRARPDFSLPAPEPGLRLLGPVPDADLPGLYSNALAVVYLSLYEGFGLPVLEAMQCGAVVVTSRDPAIMEVSGDPAGNQAAVIHIDATDTRALAQTLDAIARAPANFDSLRARALARSREFTWQRTARQTRAVYDTALRAFHQ